MISIPYYLDFFITKEEIDQPYWLVGSHRASQNNTIFGFVFESPAKKTYRDDIANYMNGIRVKYDRVTVRNKEFTISILKTGPDNKQRFYPHKFRFYSDFVSVIVKSPELLKKTNGKEVVLYIRANLLVSEISKFGFGTGMEVNNTYKLRMLSGMLAQRRTVISLESESDPESLDSKLGYYNTLPKTARFEPGYLYVIRDDKFFIYLGKLNESIQTTPEWSQVYGNFCGTRFNRFNHLDIVSTVYDLSVKNNNDLFITVSDDTRDLLLEVIDKNEVLSIQEVLSNLINKNRIFNEEEKRGYYSGVGIAVECKMKTKLSATKIGKVIGFDDISNDEVNKIIKTVSLDKFLSNGKKLDGDAFYLLKLNPDILRHHIDPKVLFDYTINRIIDKNYHAGYLANRLLEGSYPIGGYNLSGIRFLAENTMIDKTGLPKSEEEITNTIKDLLKKKYSL